MGYDGTGNYTRTHNFSADASAGIKILAARVDAEFNDFASAMPLALLRDGRNAATGNIPMGGFRHVNVGAPASATNYIRAKDFIENVPIFMTDGEASADRISVSAAFYTTASAATAPRDGSHILVRAGSDKSSAVAIRLNTGDGNPFSANVILANGSALYSGAIRSGGIYEFIWSSSDTAWQLFNPQVDYAASAYPGVILLATAAEVAAGTDVPKAVTPSQLASKFSASYATETSAGLIELATTAEGITGTNISAAVTPAVLDAVLSTYAATVTSAGAIEIATTAEATAGTDTSRAITPATLRASRLQSEPYLAVLAVDAASAASFLSRSSRASAWTTSANAGNVVVTHNIGLASANEMTIYVMHACHTGAVTRHATITSTDASSFHFTVFDASGSVGLLSANFHIIAHRIIT